MYYFCPVFSSHTIIFTLPLVVVCRETGLLMFLVPLTLVRGSFFAQAKQVRALYCGH